jgi:hypothetical protein
MQIVAMQSLPEATALQSLPEREVKRLQARNPLPEAMGGD